MLRWAAVFILNGSLLAQTPPAVVDPLGDPSLVEKGLQSTVPLQVAISAFRSMNISDQQRGEWLRAALFIAAARSGCCAHSTGDFRRSDQDANAGPADRIAAALRPIPIRSNCDRGKK
jgi:hypothetical protein